MSREEEVFTEGFKAGEQTALNRLIQKLWNPNLEGVLPTVVRPSDAYREWRGWQDMMGKGKDVV